MVSRVNDRRLHGTIAAAATPLRDDGGRLDDDAFGPVRRLPRRRRASTASSRSGRTARRCCSRSTSGGAASSSGSTRCGAGARRGALRRPDDRGHGRTCRPRRGVGRRRGGGDRAAVLQARPGRAARPPAGRGQGVRAAAVLRLRVRRDGGLRVRPGDARAPARGGGQRHRDEGLRHARGTRSSATSSTGSTSSSAPRRSSTAAARPAPSARSRRSRPHSPRRSRRSSASRPRRAPPGSLRCASGWSRSHGTPPSSGWSAGRACPFVRTCALRFATSTLRRSRSSRAGSRQRSGPGRRERLGPCERGAPRGDPARRRRPPRPGLHEPLRDAARRGALRRGRDPRRVRRRPPAARRPGPPHEHDAARRERPRPRRGRGRRGRVRPDPRAAPRGAAAVQRRAEAHAPRPRARRGARVRERRAGRGVAERLGSFVRIDMEQSSVVDATLRIYRRLREAGHDRVGTVLQSYLFRTERTSSRCCRSRPTCAS